MFYNLTELQSTGWISRGWGEQLPLTNCRLHLHPCPDGCAVICLRHCVTYLMATFEAVGPGANATLTSEAVDACYYISIGSHTSSGFSLSSWNTRASSSRCQSIFLPVAIAKECSALAPGDFSQSSNI